MKLFIKKIFLCHRNRTDDNNVSSRSHREYVTSSSAAYREVELTTITSAPEVTPNTSLRVFQNTNFEKYREAVTSSSAAYREALTKKEFPEN